MNGSSWVRWCAIVGIGVALLPLRGAAQHPFEDVAGEHSVLAAGGETEATEAEAAARDFCRCLGENDSPAIARIGAALRNPLRSAGLSFRDTPLEEVVALLQSDYGISIQLDTPALDEVGLGRDEPVTIELHNISLRSALRLMLKQLQLTYMIRDEVLLITTPKEAKADLVTCVYDVRDLTQHTNDRATKALIDAITSCVSTETWHARGGGAAQIRPLEPGLLVVSQVRSVHEEIQQLLAAIRDIREQPVPELDAAMTPAAADPLVTRFYMLNVASAADSEEIGTQVRDLIMQAMPDERWTGRLEDRQPVILSVLPDRIVVRHKQSVQSALQTFFADSGIAAQLPAGKPKTAGGGFGRGQINGNGGGFFRPAPAARE